MKINIDNIQVRKDRNRKIIGDLSELKESISTMGLLQPIGITSEKELVFGYRRLLACKELGMEQIEANIVSVPTIVEGEYAENVIRKDLTMSERVALGKEIEMAIETRRGSNQDKSEVPNQLQIIAPEIGGLTGKETREIAAGVAGFGNRETYRQAKFIVEKGLPEMIAKVDAEKMTISAAFKEIQYNEKKIQLEKDWDEAAQRYKPDDSIKIVNEDFYLWSFENIEPESVDLILTDPPYPKEYLPLWNQLAELGSRVLKPGGFLVTYSGQMYLPEVIRALSEHLSYYWVLALHHNGTKQLIRARNVFCTYKPILVFRKGAPGKFDRTLTDAIYDDCPDKSYHEWGQGENAVKTLMEIFSNPNDLVLDPFAGGGTTLSIAKTLKRKCIGIEIDSKYINAIKSRLAIQS